MNESTLEVDLSGIFEKCDLREGMTGAGIAKLLDIPVGDAPETETGDADDSHTVTSSERWLEPEPLGESLPPVPAFDPDLLPESLRPLVEDVAERMQTAIDFPAVVAVATLAGLTNRRALIQPKANDTSWVVVPNLWGGIVAPPGLMKSPVIACMTSPARAIEANWRVENDAAMKEHEAEIERHKLDCAVWAESYKKDAKKKLDSKAAKPERSSIEPTQKRLITSDATFECLHKLLAENPAGLFVLRDELTGWLAGLERQGREGERAFHLESWNGDSAATLDRIGRGTIHVEHACITLFGGIQPARLRSYMADALKDGPSNDGLIQRFQLLVWPDTDAAYKYIDRPPDPAA
jgi:putative DNA primase/helicase